jgi:hypothetical protein
MPLKRYWFALLFIAGKRWAELQKMTPLKIIIGAIGSLLLLSFCQTYFRPQPKAPSTDSIYSPSAQQPPPPPPEPPTEQDLAIYNKLAERVRRDYPDDYSTQRFVYNQQVEAYRYMQTVPASSLKSKVERDFLYDYTTQKFVYHQQTDAKEYMECLPDSKLKRNLQRQFPNDYTTQQFVYNQQLDAKQAMGDK